MNVAPILRKELKRAMQRPLLYWMRTASVLSGVILGVALLYGTTKWQSGAAVGREIFQIACWGALVLCLLSGTVVTAGLVCEERRDGGLALLFLTDLKGLDILLGKFLAVGSLGVQIVIGQFPLFALCMVLGGVSLGEFWRAVQLLLVTLSFSFVSGLFISALCKQLSRAVLYTFAFIVLVSCSIAAADWALKSAIGLPVGAIIPGVIPAMNSLWDAQYALPPQGFDLSLGYLVFASVALLVLGGLMLKRLSISDPVGSQRPLLNSTVESAGDERRKLLRTNPIYWLSGRHRSRWLTTWFVFCGLVMMWMGLLYTFDFAPYVRDLAIFALAPLLHFVLKVAIAAEAIERLGKSRTEELEMLLVTPIRGAKILQGHSKALLRQFIFPVATMVLMDLFFVFFYKPSIGSSDSAFGYLFVYTLGISLMVDLPALVWRGLWNGLRSGNSVQALRRTLLEVVVLPVPFFLLSLLVFGFFISLAHQLLEAAGLVRGVDRAAWATAIIVWWWLTAFISNFLVQQNARFYLDRWLRYIVADPFGARSVLRRYSLPGPPSKSPP